MNTKMNNNIEMITCEERELIAELYDLKNPCDRWSNCHAWLVVDGEIFDPTPVQQHGEIVAFLLGLDLNRPVYKPYHDNKNDKLIKLCELKMQRIDKKELASCFTDPQVGSCYYNAAMFKKASPKEHDVKLQFGAFGWHRKAGGDPYLEWGDTNKKSWDKTTHELKNSFLRHCKKRTKKLRLMLERSPRTDEEITGMRDVWHGRCTYLASNVYTTPPATLKNRVVYRKGRSQRFGHV